MYRLRLLLSALFILFTTGVYCQSGFIEINSDVTDGESLRIWKDRYEELEEIAEHKFNINTITKEQLEQLPFLSDELIENIVDYVDKYRPLLSKNELIGVKGMDYQTRRLLNEFIEIGVYKLVPDRIKAKDVFKYSKQEMLARVDFPFNQKAGYADYPSSVLEKYPNRKYQGDPLYTNLRYRFSYSDRVYLGITAEKDAGEPFFCKYNRKGYDHYSAYIYLNDIGRLKTLALGNYRASFGYGLVLNMGFSMGKYYSLSGMNRFGRGLTKFSSTSEDYYLQGAGATVKLAPRWNISAFYSYRKLDANVDSMFIRSLKTDGYHRTKGDMEKKHSVDNHLIGCNIDYNGKYVEAGLTAVYNYFNKELNPVYRPYNKYYPRGQDFFNAGVYYKFYMKRLVFSGETAVDRHGAIATFNSLSYSPNVNTTLLFINRYYDKKYQGLNSNGFGENSRTQNELGFYLGLETNILRKINIVCYGDLYYFPYLRYRVDKAKTMGGEGVLQTSYSPNSSLSMLIKYSYKNKAQNYSQASGKRYVIPYNRHRLHYQLNYAMNEQFLLKSYLEGICAGYYQQKSSLGMAAGITGKYLFGCFPLQTQLSFSWFKTQGYASRIYIYEPGLLYAFGMSSYYGHGLRASLNMRYEFGKWLMLQGRLGWAHYMDRNHIGSGTEEIQGKNKMDLQVQVRVKF